VQQSHYAHQTFGNAECDLAISAVASDEGFVAELITAVASRLRTIPAWRVDAPVAASDSDPTANAESAPEPATAFSLDSAHSRVVLVVHQHLWRHDENVRRDEAFLRQRVSDSPESVCVIALDDVPLPGWLARAPHYDVASAGRAGVADFVLDTIAAAGGAVRPKAAESADITSAPRWPEPPAPFLAQPRAQSALRHQLDALVEELETAVDRCKVAQPDRMFELNVLPHRLVARLDDVAVSFSWLTGGSTSIADGRLLVIAWRDVANVKGLAALKSAAMIHERSYAADGSTADAWRWRAEDPVRQPYSSADLAAAWIARISIARAG
jgi:hypothetical protein